MATPPAALPFDLIEPDRLWIGVLFDPGGLILKYDRLNTPQFNANIAGLPPAPLVVNAPHSRNWEVSVPLFNALDHKTKVAADRVTQIVFYSNQLFWKFVDGGFATKDPAHMKRFPNTTILNGGTAVSTTFLPEGQVGEQFSYNLYMETQVWVSGQKSGHAKIIIDPVVETVVVRRPK